MLLRTLRILSCKKLSMIFKDPFTGVDLFNIPKLNKI